MYAGALYICLSDFRRIAEKWRKYSLVDGAMMTRWGWIAFAGLIAGLLLLYAAIICSHVAAFRILYGMRMGLARHIGKLPLDI